MGQTGATLRQQLDLRFARKHGMHGDQVTVDHAKIVQPLNRTAAPDRPTRLGSPREGTKVCGAKYHYHRAIGMHLIETGSFASHDQRQWA